MEVLLTVAGLVLFILLMDTRGRVKRLELRLAEVRRGSEVRADDTVSAPPSPEPAQQPSPSNRAIFERVETPVEVPVAIQPEPLVWAAAVAPEGDVVAPSQPSRGSLNFEEFFGRRLPIWAGGITLAVAGVLIVGYAYDAGLLTPWVQVIAGLLFGSALLGGAEAALRGEAKVADPRVRQALAGAGLATLYAAVLVASTVHGLIGTLPALLAMSAVTGLAMALAGRFGMPTALLALAGGFATPALIGSTEPNIPLLASYLALIVGGLTAVSRSQRWAWLGIGALIGGGGWTLLLIATGALDLIATLSVGALVILLAIGVPMVAHSGARGATVKLLSALIGLAQLGALVAIGGYAPVTWGMYVIIAAAGQWLAAREPGFAILPRLSLGLSALLLLLWPEPPVRDYVIVGGAMLAVHAVPLLRRLWGASGDRSVAIELALLAVSTFALPFVRYWSSDGSNDGVLTLVAAGAALLPGIGLATGWRVEARHKDQRYLTLAVTMAGLLFAACWLALPLWSLPVAGAGLLALFFVGGQRAGDAMFERVALAAGIGLALLLTVTGIDAENELLRLAGMGEATAGLTPLLRWAAVAALFALIAARAREVTIASPAQVGAALLSYGLAAQMLPPVALALLPGVAMVGIAAASRRIAWPALAPALLTALLLLVGWAIEPMGRWSVPAALSLGGEPFEANDLTVAATLLLRRLLVPALLVAAALWLLREKMEVPLRAAIAGTAGLIGGIALHGLYKLGFAGLVGSDFVQVGVAERSIWAALLIGAGAGALRLASDKPVVRRVGLALIGAAVVHGVYYGLLLHNPLWAAQSVGGWPLINGLLAIYGLPLLGGWLLVRAAPAAAEKLDRAAQFALMLLVCGFAYSLLRQAFNGALLNAPGVGQVEDVARSLLAIALAVGFLLWGSRSNRRDWRIASLLLMIGAVGKVFLFDAAGLEGLLRIASFVALGFSLIGIGWLYSRQLRG